MWADSTATALLEMFRLGWSSRDVFHSLVFNSLEYLMEKHVWLGSSKDIGPNLEYLSPAGQYFVHSA